jgi:hypothetical protein
MKNRKVLMMLVALFCLSACHDDEDDANNANGGGNAPEVQSELTMEQVMQREAVASVLSQLTGESFSDTADVDFEGRTFEAAIGEVRNESRPSERSIRVRDADLAEGYFRSLAGGASPLIKETADGYVIDLTNLDCHSTGRKQSLGTLTFHRDGGADNVGYADIDIACIPGLQRISYKTAEQWGDNAGFKSPISWGEVFIGGNGRYWICAREASGYHQKQAGVLINMQPGKGDNWGYIYEDEKWAAWCPKDHVLTPYYATAILDYVDLCGNKDFATEKRRIMEKSWGNKVFPVGLTWTYSIADGMWVLSSGASGPGFGDTNPDNVDKWCHIGGYPVTHGVIIVRDATEGDYRVWHGQWRRWHIYCTDVYRANDKEEARMASRSYNMANASALQEYTFYYTNTNDFYRFADYAMIYTVRGIAFNTGIPEGFTKVDI